MICDPPYGIRAGARKTKKGGGDMHKGNTDVYNPDDVIIDLLDIAARCLKKGGRISYLLPTVGKYGCERMMIRILGSKTVCCILE